MNDMCIPQQKKEILLNESMDKSTEMSFCEKIQLNSLIHQNKANKLNEKTTDNAVHIKNQSII